MIHHNVVWNAKGIMVKGDDHRVYQNTTWNNKDIDLRMLIDTNPFYRHNRFIAANNASDSISYRRNMLTDITDLYLGENVTEGRKNFNGAILDGIYPIDTAFSTIFGSDEAFESM